MYKVGDKRRFDDGEWAASRVIADTIARMSQTNILVAVSRRHEGPNLGQSRFRIISDVANEVIETIKKL